MKNRLYLENDSRLRIGGNIRKWRNLRGIKQKELAIMLNLSEAAVSNIENDLTNVTLSQLEELSTGLDVTVEQLFTDPQASYTTLRSQTPLGDRELWDAIIGSIQKKDAQLEMMMQHVLQTMSSLVSGSKSPEGRQL